MSKKVSKAIPDGMHSITPFMLFNGTCRKAIDLYKKVFNAEVVGQIYPSPDGKLVWHSMIKIGDSNIMLSDMMPDHDNEFAWSKDKSAVMGNWIYDAKCDNLFNNAMKNGFKTIMPMSDTFWGDRFGQVEDPFGFRWSLAARQYEYTPEEMQQKEKEMMANTPM